ncbi:SHOCT domain-containing protein [Polaribacter sp. ALD11]|uniref:SHOCT domain-containing protein n=1 Tax=Polaribacter sp. ALD11 TaxID=2058137 RepID=UPI0026C1BBCF
MMNYDNYQFVGMHFFWWIMWIIVLFWIFATPYKIPGERAKKDTPLDILKKRFASGEINKEEFQEKKKIIEN